MKRTPRKFALTVIPTGNGSYGLQIDVAAEDTTETIATLPEPIVDRLRPSLVGAVTASGNARTTLTASRKAPIPLSEDAGVRLTLQALTTKPLSKPTRAEAIRLGVDAMTSEEALYWYANITGPHANRALRALRMLLADD